MFDNDNWFIFNPNCLEPTSPVSGVHVPFPNQITWNWGAVAWATGYKWNTVDDYGTAADMGELTTMTETWLVCNTLYTRYVWAYNDCGHSMATVLNQSTTTCSGLPVVTTADVTDILFSSATSGGIVQSDGGTAVDSRGVCWSTSPNPTLANNHTTDGNGTGSFISHLADLSPATQYYVRAYAVNSVGTAYGNELTFTTVSEFICPGLPTVTYAGQVYNTVKIGNQCWFRENLNIGTMIPNSQGQTNNGIIEKYCYDDDEANCAIYGGLYKWDEMMQYVITEGTKGICPTGWHLPTDLEWTTLATFLGGDNVAGGKMKEAGYAHWGSPNTGATNSSWFTALAGGGWDNYGGFYNLGYYAGFWSSSQGNVSSAWGRYLNHDYEGVHRYGNYNKTSGFSCMCLQD